MYRRNPSSASVAFRISCVGGIPLTLLQSLYMNR